MHMHAGTFHLLIQKNRMNTSQVTFHDTFKRVELEKSLFCPLDLQQKSPVVHSLFQEQKNHIGYLYTNPHMVGYQMVTTTSYTLF